MPSSRRSSHRSLVRRAAAGLAMALVLVSMATIQSAQAANPVQVTFTVLRFRELEDPAGAFEKDHGTYYGYVNINNQGYKDTRNMGYGEASHNPDIQPYWRFTSTVDAGQGTVPISVQVKDDDTGVPASVDDVMDLNPKSSVRELHLSFNLATGSWTDVDSNITNVGWSKGNGDTANFGDGGEQASVLFDVGFGNDNLAGDGIPDGVKHFGVRNIDDGSLVANMAALGADPCRKNVPVRVDYMSGAADGHTHKLKPEAKKLAQDTYDNAPNPAVSPCPYPGFPTKPAGIKLIIDEGRAVPEMPVMAPDDANFLIAKKAGFPDALTPYFFYLIMVHDQAAGSSSSGLSCGGGTRDYIVSLGSWDSETGTATDQGTSLMHELGHCLGLGHGGGDGINCKPNYLSMMNYDFQTTGIPSSTPGGSARFDYSTKALPPLNESAKPPQPALVEANGVGGDGKDLTAWTPDKGATKLTASTSGAIDWNNNKSTDANPVSVDVNALNSGNCGTVSTAADAKPGEKPNPSPGETLTGYDDWTNLHYLAPLAATAGASGVTHPGTADMDYPAALKAKAFWSTVFVTARGGAPLPGTEGAALSGASLATLTTTEPSTTASNFTASVDWGDGVIAPGIISGPTGGPFAVKSGHTYAEEGTFPIGVVVTDIGGAKKVARTTATIADAALSARGTSLAPVEGVPFTAATVASFTDADPAGTASDYAGVIDWGDGTTSAGTVTGSGTFSVAGDHTYAEEGAYTATVKIADVGGATVSTTTAVRVADAALTAAGRIFSTTNPVDNKVVATFTDADATNTSTDSNQDAADYTASIDWGDGSPVTAGTPVPNGIGFNITGSHTYPPDGPVFTYPVKVHVCDVGGSCADTTSTIKLLYLTGRAYAASANVLGGILKVPPTPDTGPVATTAQRSTTTPCTANLVALVLNAHDLCANVTTAVDARAETGTSTAKATVSGTTVLGIPLFPLISLTGIQATSVSTCGGASGATAVGAISVGGRSVAVPSKPNSTVALPGGARLIFNEQLPVPGSDYGMTVNAVHLIVPSLLLGNVDVVLASATSDIHNCPS